MLIFPRKEVHPKITLDDGKIVKIFNKKNTFSPLHLSFLHQTLCLEDTLASLMDHKEVVL